MCITWPPYMTVHDFSGLRGVMFSHAQWLIPCVQCCPCDTCVSMQLHPDETSQMPASPDSTCAEIIGFT